jgi:hypothetical protein
VAGTSQVGLGLWDVLFGTWGATRNLSVPGPAALLRHICGFLNQRALCKTQVTGVGPGVTHGLPDQCPHIRSAKPSQFASSRRTSRRPTVAVRALTPRRPPSRVHTGPRSSHTCQHRALQRPTRQVDNAARAPSEGLPIPMEFLVANAGPCRSAGRCAGHVSVTSSKHKAAPSGAKVAGAVLTARPVGTCHGPFAEGAEDRCPPARIASRPGASESTGG